VKGVRIIPGARHDDGRGWLHKVLLRSHLPPGRPFGEVYVVCAAPGAARGNHVHRKMGEYFAVVGGEGVIAVVDPATGEREEIPARASDPRTIYVPEGLAHAIVNTGDGPLIAVAWAEGEHDPDDAEPYPVFTSRT